MQSPAREPSMEDILASIKKVIAEEKAQRGAPRVEALNGDSGSEGEDADPEHPEEILELDEPLAPPVDLGPPLIDENIAGRSREALEQLTTIAASVPAQMPANPLEDMVREM